MSKAMFWESCKEVNWTIDVAGNDKQLSSSPDEIYLCTIPGAKDFLVNTHGCFKIIRQTYSIPQTV